MAPREKDYTPGRKSGTVRDVCMSRYPHDYSRAAERVNDRALYSSVPDQGQGVASTGYPKQPLSGPSSTGIAAISPPSSRQLLPRAPTPDAHHLSKIAAPTHVGQAGQHTADAQRPQRLYLPTVGREFQASEIGSTTAQLTYPSSQYRNLPAGTNESRLSTAPPRWSTQQQTAGIPPLGTLQSRIPYDTGHNLNPHLTRLASHETSGQSPRSHPATRARSKSPGASIRSMSQLPGPATRARSRSPLKDPRKNHPSRYTSPEIPHF
ncbi:hypothetical protein P389DRAFT_72611 [Cystobasidium minutum MCA 4210]|uniref:uncharacterized protein n=1 Tax=Cystobasidium minutum MCA 4210 TaxID=1397322 RepID=UPI0034CE456E|eukprot:jgi/Rhomi1/72611/CE72610_431